MRVFDVGRQRKPFMEFEVASLNPSTGGHTGVKDLVPRPVNATSIAFVRGAGWSLFVGNNLGMLREFDLRMLPDWKRSSKRVGTKAHARWARQQFAYRGGYGGIMGAVRAIGVHADGGSLVAVGPGRYAYMYVTSTRGKRGLPAAKIFLKQKLCSVLVSEEPYEPPREPRQHREKRNVKDEKKLEDMGPACDELHEGFSDDEVLAASSKTVGDAIEGDDIAKLGEGDEVFDRVLPSMKKRLKKRKRRTLAAHAEQSFVEQPDEDANCDDNDMP